MGKNTKSNKQRRAEVLLSAAQITVEILHDLCFKCAVGEDCAAHFYGSSKVPAALTMTVLRPASFSFGHTALENTILVEDPTHYYRSGQNLVFINPAFQGGKNWCMVTLMVVDSDFSFPIYRCLPQSLPLPSLSFLILLKLESWAEIPPPGTKMKRTSAKAVAKLLKINPPQDAAHTEFTTFGEWTLEWFEVVVKRYSLVAPDVCSRWKLHFKNIFQSVDLWTKAVESPKIEPMSMDMEQMDGTESTLGSQTHLHAPSISSAPSSTTLLSRTLPAVAEPAKFQYLNQVEVVMLAAKTAIAQLAEMELPCAVFGGLACHLYGSSRIPNDVDLLILHEGMDQEHIKAFLVAGDPAHFFLKPSKDPEATYRVLHYRLGDSMYTAAKGTCKVDILVPGILHLPYVDPHRLTWVNNVPLVPFSLLLLQKLQGWDDHRHAEEVFKRVRQEIDVADIRALLSLEYIVPLRFTRPWLDTTLFSEEFRELSVARVKDLCAAFPDLAKDWTLLGFDVTPRLLFGSNYTPYYASQLL